MNKRKVYTSVFILIIVFLGFGRMYWYERIDKTFECISFVIGEDKAEDINVRIVGKKYYSLLRDDRLKFQIYINDLKIPYKEKDVYVLPEDFEGIAVKNGRVVAPTSNMMNNKFRKFRNCYTVDLKYTHINEHTLRMNEHVYYGLLYFTKDFDEIIITHSKSENGIDIWRFDKGYEMIASEKTINDSEILFLKLMNMKLIDKENN